MQIRKSLVTCAVFMALGLTQTAFAQTALTQPAEDNKADKGSERLIQTDIIASAAGNVIILTQESQEGAVYGNSIQLAQEGDTNGVDASVNGDDNDTEVGRSLSRTVQITIETPIK